MKEGGRPMSIVLYSLCCYLVGSFMTAAVVGKLSGVSLAAEHSGNLGARNAGRTLGKMAFVWTAAGDVLKGVAVVLAARALGLADTVAAVGLTCALLGHLYPVWWRFRGGKGVATLLGGLLALEPVLLLGALLVMALGYLVTKSLTLGFVVSVVVLAMVIVAFYPAYFILLLVLAGILWKHRTNIQQRWR